ncbi:MAG: TolC family protein [Candidatus Poribacteria bacterium]|nr:TolC family protein [Candidatus Poribacteria bacterium]
MAATTRRWASHSQRWGIGIAAILLAAGIATAQDTTRDMPDLSQPLTLDDCIELALQYATNVRTAELSLNSSEIGVSDARAAYLPSLSTSGRYFANQNLDFGFERENVDWSVSADYLLWDSGRRKITLDQANLDFDSAELALKRTKRDLVLNIVQAYYRVLEAQQLTDLDQELLAVSQGNVNQVQAFVDVGRSIEADIAAVEVRLANDELRILNDENALQTALANLPVTMGLPYNTPLTLAEDREFDIYAQLGQINRYAKTLDETVNLALQQRQEVVESELNLQFLGLSRKRATLDRLPRVTASGDYSVDLDGYLDDRENFQNHRSWNAGVNVSFPIFDGGVTRRAVERADLNLERAQEQHDSLVRGIALEAQNAYLSLLNAEKRLQISSVQVRNARLNLDVTRERYQQEVAILLELLDAQTQFGQATVNQVQAFYDYKVAQRELDRAIGKEAP